MKVNQDSSSVDPTQQGEEAVDEYREREQRLAGD